jgi:hypothetical protein
MSESRVQIAQLLERHSWMFCNDPFPHVRAQAVFTPTIYRELEGAFETILSGRPLASWPAVGFSRNMPGYDACAIDFDVQVGWPFSVFVSRSWHDLFTRLFGVDGNLHVSGALHHHAAGSRAGFVHNDLNPGWFVDADGADVATPVDVAIPQGHLCNYRNGVTLAGAAVNAIETIRGVAIIYYLNNSDWSAGDGGETGLYRAGRDPVGQYVVAVPPVNNSLVAFECTPSSFHSFLANPRRPRNSVCVWLHRPKETVVAKWGNSAIVPWQ